MTQIIQAKAIDANDISFIIDVRTRDEFMQEYIAGSHNIPLDDLAQSIEQLKSKEKIIVSCRSGNRAAQACGQLDQWGLENVQLLEGGLNGWKAAKRQTLSLKRGFSIMQQVQLIVGLMVLLGTFYKPLWILAPIAGTGMLIAGLTNTCMMAVILGKIPWNKLSSPSPTQCSLR